MIRQIKFSSLLVLTVVGCSDYEAHREELLEERLRKADQLETRIEGPGQELYGEDRLTTEN